MNHKVIAIFSQAGRGGADVLSILIVVDRSISQHDIFIREISKFALNARSRCPTEHEGKSNGGSMWVT